MYTCIHAYMHIYIYIHTYIHIHIHTYIHTYIHTCIHTYIHTFIHTYIHTYIHVRPELGGFGIIACRIGGLHADVLASVKESQKKHTVHSKPDETEKRQSERNQRPVAPRGKKAKR